MAPDGYCSTGGSGSYLNNPDIGNTVTGLNVMGAGCGHADYDSATNVPITPDVATNGYYGQGGGGGCGNTADSVSYTGADGAIGRVRVEYKYCE
jgi:hypothetical protein